LTGLVLKSLNAPKMGKNH